MFGLQETAWEITLLFLVLLAEQSRQSKNIPYFLFNKGIVVSQLVLAAWK